MTAGRITTLLLVLVMLLAFAACKQTEEEPALPHAETTVQSISKHGNIVLEIPPLDLFALGFEYGDTVTVTIGDASVEMPVGSDFSDVDTGKMVCRVKYDPQNEAENSVTLAIMMGDLATTLGIAAKETIEADPGFVWNYAVSAPVAVSITLKEKGGYYDEYMLRQLVRSNERAEYPELTDEEFANFRMIAATGVAAGVLYRSSSPVNPELNRNVIADAALERAGIRTVINLADSEQVMRAYEGYAERAYAKCDVVCLDLPVDFMSDAFRSGLADGLRFLAAHDGPYLIHCTEGKDRAGFVSALLECLMGASKDEVIADYMITYYNYYGVKPGTEQYDTVVRASIQQMLCASFGIEDLENADLSACAKNYLKSIGLSDDTVSEIIGKLSAGPAD